MNLKLSCPEYSVSRILLIILIIGIATAGCKKPEFIDKNQDAKELSSFETLPDSSFFAAVEEIVFADGQYYFADYKRNLVYQCTEDFQVINKFGQKGKGPGDLNGPNGINVNSQFFFVWEEFNQRISAFSKTDHSFSRIFPNDFKGVLYSGRVIDDSLNLYCSGRSPEGPLMLINLDSKQITVFGKFTPSSDPREQRANNRYHVCQAGNFILAVHQSRSIIEVYRKATLELVETFDYSNLQVVRSRTDYRARDIAADPNKRYATYMIASDIVVSGDYLYLLVCDNLDPEKAYNNKVIRIKVRGSRLVYDKTLILNNKDEALWFTAFTVNSQNQIVAYSPQTMKFYVFSVD